MSEIIKYEPGVEDWEIVRKNRDEIVKRLKNMLVNGKKYTDVQIQALTDYARTTGLNPFNDECYATPIGIIPGVAGYRRRGLEQLYVEADAARVLAPYYTIDYFPATAEEAKFDPDAGDLAWKAVLTDAVSRDRWMRLVNSAAEGIRQHSPDATFLERMDAARAMAGPEPRWWAVGVVSGKEEFAKWVDYNDHSKGRAPEMWDRNERAKKRAAKGAIKQRFGGLRLPSWSLKGDKLTNGALGVDQEPVITVDSGLLDNPKERRDPTEIVSELGYDTSVVEEPEMEPVPKPSRAKLDGRPYPVDTLLQGLANQANKLDLDHVVDERERGQFAAALDQFTTGKRKQVQVALGLLESTKESNQMYLQAVMDWLGSSWNKDAQEYVVAKPVVLDELALVVAGMEL